MHEKAPLISVTKRERAGTRYCDRLRKSGGLPAVVYGRGKSPVSITLDMREAVTHIKKGEKVFRLDFPGDADIDEGQIVLLKDLQFDYLGTNIVHADFARVSLTDRVKTRVPIHFSGEAPGLKTAGAILMHPTNEVEVECLLSELPEFIEVSVAALDVDHAIHAADIKLPSASMTLLTDGRAMIAQIVIQQEIVVAEATPTSADAAQPEVITAKKPAEGEEAKPGAAGAKAPAGGAKAAAGAAAKPAAGAEKKK